MEAPKGGERIKGVSRLSTASSPEEVYRLALAQMLEDFGCERALVAHGAIALGVPKPRASHAIPTEDFLNSTTLSLSVLREVVQENRPLCLTDAQTTEFGSRTSAILSGLRSILCVPLTDASGNPDGLLYMDSRVKKGIFGDEHLARLARLAQTVGAKLHQFTQPTKHVLAHRSEFETLRRKALEALRESHWDDAETWLMAAREVAQNWGVRSLDYGRIVNDLGQLYKLQGRLYEARPLLEQALEVAEEHPPSPERLAALNNLAGLCIREGDHHSGLALLKRAVAVTGPFDHLRICLYYNLAIVSRRMRDEGTARACLERLAPLLEQVAHRPDYVERASSEF